MAFIEFTGMGSFDLAFHKDPSFNHQRLLKALQR